MPNRYSPSPGASTQKTVAYVLKGYPRLSETFIASEIYRLEQQGMPVRLFVIKPADEQVQHPIVERIQAQPEYLPDAGSVSATSFWQWLVTYGPAFFPAMRRVCVSHPVRFLRAVVFACRQAVRARRSWWAWPRKVYAKEFFQAVALADRLRATPEVRHLHAHFCHGATTVTWMAALLTSLPFSFTAHAKDIYTESLNPAGFLRRKLLAARFAITCTEVNRQYLQCLAPSAKVHRIYHGINADFARLTAEAALQKKPQQESVVRLLAVGRLVEKKGFDIFIEACGLLQQQRVAFTAVIAGEEGDQSDRVRQRVAALGLSASIRFLGPLRQDVLFAEYQRASVFCLPCRVLDDGDRDGIPNVLMEAMACGVPVITTHISGIPELISDGVNGLLIPAEDPAALAAAVLRIHQDPSLAQQLVVNAQRTVREQFNGDRLVVQLITLFVQTFTNAASLKRRSGMRNESMADARSTSTLQRQLS